MRTPLRSNERLILEVRKHWIVVSNPASLALFVMLVFYAIHRWVIDFGQLYDIYPFIGAVLLLVGFYFFYVFYERSINIWAVTNQRVIDEYGLLSRGVKECPVDRILNITCDQNLWGRILDYGTLQIQTGAEMGLIRYVCVTSPGKLKDAVIRAQEEYKELQIRAQAERIASAMRSVQSNTNTGPAVSSPSAESESDGDGRECPFCAEIIKAKAKVCRYCGRFVGQLAQ